MSQSLPSNPRAGNLGKYLHPRGGIPTMLAKDVLKATTPKPLPSQPQPAKTNTAPTKRALPLSGFAT